MKSLQSRIPKDIRESVKVIDSNRGTLQCDICGQGWALNVGRGGRLPRGWWKCPNRCYEQRLSAV